LIVIGLENHEKKRRFVFFVGTKAKDEGLLSKKRLSVAIASVEINIYRFAVLQKCIFSFKEISFRNAHDLLRTSITLNV